MSTSQTFPEAFTETVQQDKNAAEAPILEIIEAAKAKVIGQDEALRQLIGSIKKSLARCNLVSRGMPASELGDDQITLLIGSSGSGKTYILKTITQLMGLQAFTVNCASITGTGWSGANLDDALEPVADFQTNNPGEASVIIWDEFDKLSHDDKNNNSFDAANAFLKPLDGGRYEFQTSGSHENKTVDLDLVVHVAAGAFTGIADQIRKTHSASFGFSAKQCADVIDTALSDDEVRVQISSDDLVHWGVSYELSGRVSSTIFFKDLDEKSLIRIANEFIVPREEKIFQGCEARGTKLTLEPEAASFAAKKAISERTGARGVRNALSSAINEGFVLACSDKTICEIKLQLQGSAIIPVAVTGQRSLLLAEHNRNMKKFREREKDRKVEAAINEIVCSNSRCGVVREKYKPLLRRLFDLEPSRRLSHPIYADAVCSALLAPYGLTDDTPERAILKTCLYLLRYHFGSDEDGIDPSNLGELLLLLSAAICEDEGNSPLEILLFEESDGTKEGYAAYLHDKYEEPWERAEFSPLDMYQSFLRYPMSRRTVAIKNAMKRLVKAALFGAECTQLKHELLEIVEEYPHIAKRWNLLPYTLEPDTCSEVL